MKLLNPNLDIDFFDKTFSQDILEMYVNPESISIEHKNRIKEIALSLTEEFKSNIIEFYFDKMASEMSEDDFDILWSNFEKFIDKLEKTLIPLQSEIVVYQSVAIMWTGILTQLERESKIIADVGMIGTSQHFFIEFIKIQNAFYKELKN